MKAVRCSASYSSNQNRNKKRDYQKLHSRIGDARKADIKEIFSTLDNIAKTEVERTKSMIDEHLAFFRQEDEPILVPIPIDDDYFTRQSK
jgi:hypothetical protein